MEFRGTKGWYLKDDYLKDENNDTVADLFGSREKDKANALLISKAHELLEMVDELLKELAFHGYTHSTAICKANELIKEATTL